MAMGGEMKPSATIQPIKTAPTPRAGGYMGTNRTIAAGPVNNMGTRNLGASAAQNRMRAMKQRLVNAQQQPSQRVVPNYAGAAERRNQAAQMANTKAY